MDKLSWIQKNKKELLKTRVLSVTEINSVSPEGDEGNFIVMDAPDWVVVIPEIDENFLMVKQWRHGENNLSIEFPGGVIDEGENPEQAAERELMEETGYTAGKMTYLGKANPNPAIMSNHVHFFAAEGLYKAGQQNLDEDEYIDFMMMAKKDVIRRFGEADFSHSLMMAALMRYLALKTE